MQLSSNYVRVFQGYQFRGVETTPNGTVLVMENETGRGSMQCYDVFPGVLLIYNHLQMETCYQVAEPITGFLQINHCRQGCYELTMTNGSLCFIGEGDLSVHDPELLSVTDSRIPSGKYEGISIMLELEPAAHWLNDNAPWADLNLFEIKQKLGMRREALLIRANSHIEHIFDELYRVDERIRSSYSVLKVIELLLFLSLTAGSQQKFLPHFSPAVVDGTRQAFEFMKEHPFYPLTLSELSMRFHVAETSLKSCFKAIYGKSPGAFVRGERIRIGARLLLDYPEMNIGEIALKAGYENPSKFAGAFKTIMGETPLAYRHRRTARNDGLDQK